MDVRDDDGFRGGYEQGFRGMGGYAGGIYVLGRR